MKMLFKKTVLTVFLVGLCFSSALSAEPKKPGKRDRCPVCGMFVAPYPDWISTIVFKDGSQVFFDGCKDLFRYYFDLSKDEGKVTRDEIAEIYVTEYYSTQLVPANSVFFVLGSDVYGPMGKELIPVSGKEFAETFMRDHSGTHILTFKKITPETLPAQ